MERNNLDVHRLQKDKQYTACYLARKRDEGLNMLQHKGPEQCLVRSNNSQKAS